MEKKVLKFIQVWKSNQNGWAYLTEGVAPCLAVGQHHGCEPKIVEIYDTQMQELGVDGREESHPH